ncbi:MAG: MogA/MoaB family molybdenum cofactor biosynthesis protein [Chloroflexi bacterium]|nr:MogA/MoaB family molybdenum cofactor biosynthesis protein [Chloroflexota bacterium]
MSSEREPRRSRSALVLTVSDRSFAGTRPDVSGEQLAERLTGLGFTVERRVVPDEVSEISAALVDAAGRHPLIITTGGTGLTPRDVTPQATAVVLDHEVPGIAEAMRADGRRSTPFAMLSRSVAGVRNGSLIVNVPGSPRGALESLEVLVPILDHALETLAGPFDHPAARSARQPDSASEDA